MNSIIYKNQLFFRSLPALLIGLIGIVVLIIIGCFIPQYKPTLVVSFSSLLLFIIGCFIYQYYTPLQIEIDSKNITIRFLFRKAISIPKQKMNFERDGYLVTITWEDKKILLQLSEQVIKALSENRS